MKLKLSITNCSLATTGDRAFSSVTLVEFWRFI